MESRPPDIHPTAEPRRHEREIPTGSEREAAGSRDEPTDEPASGRRHARLVFAGSTLARFARRPALVLVVVALIAGIPRFWNLGTPGVDKSGQRVYVFDETYYAKDACLYAGNSLKYCDLDGDGEQSWVHPPLGKWMIAAGIKLFGDTPLGARVSSAAIGTATVVLIAYLALLLFGSVVWSFVAGVLAATESLLFVQSRMALLDIFVAFWVVLGFVFVVLDRRYIQRRTPARAAREPAPTLDGPGPQLSLGPGAMARSESATQADPEDREGGHEDPPSESGDDQAAHAPWPRAARRHPPSPLWRPWRFAAGFAFGAAVATKWNGAPALAGALFLMVAWEIGRRSEPGAVRPGELVGGLALGLVVVADGFAFGGAFAQKWSSIPGLAGLLLLVIAGLWLVVKLLKPPVPAGPSGIALTLVLLAAVFGEGFAAGAAAGGRWSGFVPLAGVLGVVLAAAWWEWNRRRREVRRNPLADTVKRESLGLILAMVILPLLVYIGSYSGTIDPNTYPKYHPGLGVQFNPGGLKNLWGLTLDMLHFHEHLYAYDPNKPDNKAHPYQSEPWTWPYMGRPVAYYYQATHEGKPQEKRSEILGIGNPAIFWSSFLTVPWLLWFLVRRRDWVTAFLLVGILSQYLFWFIPRVSLSKVQFFFYATPIVPFLVLAAIYVLRDASLIRIQGSRSRPLMPLVWGYVATAVGLFVWFWPVLTATWISLSWWQRIVWFPGWV